MLSWLSCLFHTAEPMWDRTSLHLHWLLCMLLLCRVQSLRPQQTEFGWYHPSWAKKGSLPVPSVWLSANAQAYFFGFSRTFPTAYSALESTLSLRAAYPAPEPWKTYLSRLGKHLHRLEENLFFQPKAAQEICNIKNYAPQSSQLSLHGWYDLIVSSVLEPSQSS